MADVINEDADNYYVQTRNAGVVPVSKVLLSRASPSVGEHYAAKLNDFRARQSPVSSVPNQTDMMTPAAEPNMSVAAPALIPLAPPPAPEGTADEYVAPAAVAPQAAPAMPMTMTTVSEQPGVSTTQKALSPVAEKALADAYSTSAKAIEAQTAAQIGIQKAQAEKDAAISDAQLRWVEENIANEKERLVRLKEGQNRYQGEVDKLATMKVDPDKFWAEKSTGQKIGIAIAMALGAVGQTLANSKENYSLDVIDKAIDRDIAAQKANIAAQGEVVGARRNSLSMLRETLGDERLAELALKDSYIEKVKKDFVAVMAGKKNAEVLASGQAAMGKLSEWQAGIRTQANQINQTMTAGGQKSSVTVETPKAGVRSEDPLWTSFGKAPDAEAAKTIRAADAAYKSGAAELENYRKKIATIGTLSPYKWGTKEKGAYEAATESVKNTLREVKNMGVLQPSESKELENRLGGIKTPQQLDAYASELESWLGRSMQSKLKAYGIGNRSPAYTPASFSGGK